MKLGDVSKSNNKFEKNLWKIYEKKNLTENLEKEIFLQGKVRILNFSLDRNFR